MNASPAQSGGGIWKPVTSTKYFWQVTSQQQNCMQALLISIREAVDLATMPGQLNAIQFEGNDGHSTVTPRIQYTERLIQLSRLQTSKASLPLPHHAVFLFFKDWCLSWSSMMPRDAPADFSLNSCPVPSKTGRCVPSDFYGGKKLFQTGRWKWHLYGSERWSWMWCFKPCSLHRILLCLPLIYTLLQF